MIFTKVRLHPFAGLIDVELEFAPGLNTVLGENEATKYSFALKPLILRNVVVLLGGMHWRVQSAASSLK